ncbi:hypothetical protein [Polynucleobacter antarcticus]|uniref:Uncharacterized protein n=1 Tax=Polynucleobacter antarcticus TaxID=1743162 RepID=A0A6M9PSA9_9BURK|nr:hypothetical protein [Polynucleobacter antarcticus]QKM62378.1 hypothetical protein DCO16_04445 [Polynucleobacter antarcticus]
MKQSNKSNSDNVSPPQEAKLSLQYQDLKEELFDKKAHPMECLKTKFIVDNKYAFQLDELI